MSLSRTRNADPVRTTRRLVAAGMLAAPVLVITWAAQALLRDGYDVTRHPMSLLALGGGGIVQIANFVVTGLLVIALGQGFRRVYTDGVGRVWIPRLVQLTGAGLVASGVFTTDAGAGFPAGAPEGMPDYSVHGVLHEVGFAVVMVSWTATLVILYRRFRRAGNRPLARSTAGTFLAVLVLSALPHIDSFPVRTVAAAGVQLAFLALIARRELPRQEG
jgi:hypothetical protein